VQCPERLALEPDAIGGAGQAQRRGYGLDSDVVEACAGERLLGDTGRAEAERPRLSRGGRWQLGAAPDDADGNGEERVAFGGGVDDGGQAPAGTQGAPDAASAACWFGK
jgi:hypothetical protein